MRKLNGYRLSHRNKWLLVKHKKLTIQELILLEFYIDIFDFDIRHEKFGMFEIDFREIAMVFNNSSSTIRNWHKGILEKKLIKKTNKRGWYRLVNPERYIPSGKWKGNPTTFVGQEKDQSVETILQSMKYETQPSESFSQPVEEKTPSSASNNHSKALGSYKDDLGLISVSDSNDISHSSKESLQPKNSLLTDDDKRWIDEDIKSRSTPDIPF
jgi:hypothetical protein